jgi:putative Mn2+ efflux pump MntP
MTEHDVLVLVRFFMNASWAVSSFIMLAVLVRYVWLNRYEPYDAANWFAASLFVLVGGHTLRSWSSTLEWGAFVAKLNSGFWGHWAPFLAATFIVIVGKLMCIYIFLPQRWHRWRWIGGITGLTVTLPAIAYLVLRRIGEMP